MSKVKIKNILFFACIVMMLSCNENQYSEGMHWDYSISCQDGFVYKHLGGHRGTIPVLNSDGTHLKCGKKRY